MKVMTEMAEHKEIVCIIPARSGSKGIKGKNLANLDGRSLLEWSIAGATASSEVDRVIVSTDSDEIATLACKCGAEVPFLRPEELAGDEVHAVHVVLHVLDWLEQEENYRPQGVLMLLPTSPLRLVSDINEAIRLFRANSLASVVSVVDLGKYMTNLRYIDGHHLVRVAPGENPNAQRQGLKKLFAVNGSIFLSRPDVLKSRQTFHTDETLAYVMDPLRSIDINSLDDLLLARKICSVFKPWKS